MIRFRTYFLMLLFCMMSINVTHAEPNFPELTGRVVDLPGIIDSATKQSIIGKLEAFESKSSVQIVVAVVNSLEGYEIRDYGYQLARHWAIGQKDVNNGVLLLVAPLERKMAIEVGYGVEGSLTDAVSFYIISDKMTPLFKQGKMARGIEAGIDNILQALVGEIADQDIIKKRESQETMSTILFFLFFFGVVGFILFNGIRDIFGLRKGGSSRNDDDDHWGGGSSWSGSSGGSSWSGGLSFSGGGGSFGGGGASGGW